MTARTYTGARKGASRQTGNRPQGPATFALYAAIALLGTSPTSRALTLGDLTQHSRLGQPLHASIPVTLAAGETLGAHCLQASGGNSGLPGPANLHLAVPDAAAPGTYLVRLASTRPLHEPMYEIVVQLRCSGSPVITRQYVLMLDIGGAATLTATLDTRATNPAAPTPTTSPRAPLRPVVAMETPAPAPRPRRQAARGPMVAQDSLYTVVAGDSLSSIAARVVDRRINLWQMAALIHAANPEAFIRNDPDRLRLGAELRIPRSDVNGTPALPAATARHTPSPMQTMADTPPAAGTRPDAAEAPAEGSTTAQTLVIDAQPTPVTAAPAARLDQAPAARPTREKAGDLPVARRQPADGEATENPVVAALSGAITGLLISGLMWLRWGRRRVSRTPAMALQPSSPAIDVEPAAQTMPCINVREEEPAISVTYTDADDPLARDFLDASTGHATVETPAVSVTGDEITNELEALFGNDSPSTDGENTDEWRVADNACESLDDEMDATVSSPAVAQASRDDTGIFSATGTLDLTALASSARHDPQQARTLVEALSLLERDYQEELTASQLLDPEAVREALASGGAGMPAGVASSRRKSG